MRTTCLTCCAVLFLISCNQAPHPKTPPAAPAVSQSSPAVSPQPPVIPDSSLYHLGNYLEDLTSTGQHFTVRPDTLQTIRGAGGTLVTVVPADLEFKDGSRPAGPVDVTLIELSTQADFLRNRAPTTSGGRLLVSGGSYYIGCSSAGKALQLKKGKRLSARFPRQTADSMRLFYGSRQPNGLVNWTPANKDFAPAPAVDSITIRLPIPHFRDTVLAEMNERTSINLDKYRRYRPRIVDSMDRFLLVGDNPARVDTMYREQRVSELSTIVSDLYETVQLANLGWINCDRFQTSEKTTLAYAAPGTSGATQSFLVYRSINSVMAETSESSAGVYRNVPVGQPVRLIVIGWAGGHPVAAAQDLIVERTGAVQLRLKPINRRELLAMMGGAG